MKFLRGVSLVFVLGMVGMGCASKSSLSKKTFREDQSYLRSELVPAFLLEETEKFLQWQKGYNLRVQDPMRGLIVTDWVEDSPISRHQLTIRVNRDIEGSILTAHVVRQEFAGQVWREAPTIQGMEEGLIRELNGYLAESSRVKKP